MANKDESFTGLTSFIIGGILGSTVTFFLTPLSGEELRNSINREFNSYIRKAKKRGQDLIKDAKSTSNDLQIKADQLMSLVKKYASGNYEGPVDKLEKEIKSIKAAYNAVLESYNKKKEEAESTEEIIEEIFSDYEDESLPKQEGMRRRSDI